MNFSLNTQAVTSPINLLGPNGEVVKALTFKPEGTITTEITPAQVCAEFKARPGTHRHAALTFLARHFGRAVSRADLLVAVYGSDDRANIGALGMCLEGARKSIKKGLPFMIVKENATIALMPIVKKFALAN